MTAHASSCHHCYHYMLHKAVINYLLRGSALSFVYCIWWLSVGFVVPDWSPTTHEHASCRSYHHHHISSVIVVIDLVWCVIVTNNYTTTFAEAGLQLQVPLSTLHSLRQVCAQAQILKLKLKTG